MKEGLKNSIMPKQPSTRAFTKKRFVSEGMSFICFGDDKRVYKFRLANKNSKFTKTFLIFRIFRTLRRAVRFPRKTCGVVLGWTSTLYSIHRTGAPQWNPQRRISKHWFITYQNQSTPNQNADAKVSHPQT